MNKHVLVIDDEIEGLNLMCLLLNEAGFQVSKARTTSEALATMQKSPVQTILLDIFLGDENGLAFLPKLKDLHPNVPVVILTGVGYDHTMIKTALNNGACTYFSKEIWMENIIPLLKQLIPF